MTVRARARVVVLGGGNAGLSIAGRLHRAGIGAVTVVEPNELHVFTPFQSHVAGGVVRRKDAVRRQAALTPSGVTWVQGTAAAVRPDDHAVDLASGDELEYDHLVVAAGLRMRWDGVPGLTAALASPELISSHELELATKASRALRDLRSGTVVFTQAPEPASCAAVAQKPMYLACDWWRSRGVLGDIRVIFATPESTLFAEAGVDDALRQAADEYGIEVRTDTDLLGVDAETRTVDLGRGARHERLDYDLLHVAPPQSAHEWLRQSPLSGPTGFVDVDPEILRHRAHPEVWALGDAAELDTRRSGGAIRRQSAILAKNLLAAIDGHEPSARYDGYSVAPVAVSRHRLVFAEFDRRMRPQPTIPSRPGPRTGSRLAWRMDRYVLPWVYWHLILRGRV